MSGGISEAGIVRVHVVFLHVLVLSDSCDEEPQRNGNQDSFPQSAGNLVPHLLVEKMDLLHSSEVVFATLCISQGPDSEIMHVSHLGPSMLELNTIFDVLVHKLWLIQVGRWSNPVPEVLGSCPHVRKFIHN